MTTSPADHIAFEIRRRMDTISAGMVGLSLHQHADAIALMSAEQIRSLAAQLIAPAALSSAARHG